MTVHRLLVVFLLMLVNLLAGDVNGTVSSHEMMPSLLEYEYNRPVPCQSMPNADCNNKEHNEWRFQHYKKAYEFHSCASKWIFVLTILIVVITNFIAFWKIFSSDEVKDNSTLEVSNYKIKANGLYVILIVSSWVFYYLYLTQVYPLVRGP